MKSGSEGTMGNIQKTSSPLPLSFLSFILWEIIGICNTEYILVGIGRPDIALRQDSDLTIPYMQTDSDYLVGVNEKRICWDYSYPPDTRDHVDFL